MIPGDLKYTNDHEWIKVEGEAAVIGVTDYAQSQLGDVTFVELPSKGKTVSQKEPIATVESIKAASEVYAPASGEVIDVNEKLRGAPELVNQSPYEDGWICKISLSNLSDLGSLMDATGYEEYLGTL